MLKWWWWFSILTLNHLHINIFWIFLNSTLKCKWMKCTIWSFYIWRKKILQTNILFQSVTISILWKTFHFFTQIFFCPKPFCSNSNTKRKDDSPINFDFMPKKDSYDERTESNHFFIVLIKNMVGTYLWSWVSIFAQPKSQLEAKKYSHIRF